MTWPFLVWGSLILLSYAVSLSSLSGLSADLVNVKLFQRSLGQASRVVFFANGVRLCSMPEYLLAFLY